VPVLLSSLVRADLIFPRLEGTDRMGVLRAFAQALAERGVVRDADQLFERLWDREQLGSTAIGAGVAIPHCKLEQIHEVILAVGLSPAGVDFDSVDGKQVHVFFLVLSPADAPAEHLKSLAAISRWAKLDEHATRLMEMHDAASIYDLLREEPGE